MYPAGHHFIIVFITDHFNLITKYIAITSDVSSTGGISFLSDWLLALTEDGLYPSLNLSHLLRTLINFPRPWTFPVSITALAPCQEAIDNSGFGGSDICWIVNIFTISKDWKGISEISPCTSIYLKYVRWMSRMSYSPPITIILSFVMKFNFWCMVEVIAPV